MLNNIFNVDNQFSEDFKKVFYQTLGVAISTIIFAYVNYSIMGIDNIWLKYSFCLFAVYYWIFFIDSMSLLANKQKRFSVWCYRYNLLKKLVYMVFSCMLVLITYQAYELFKPEYGFREIFIVACNYLAIYLYYRFWKYLDECYFERQRYSYR